MKISLLDYAVLATVAIIATACTQNPYNSSSASTTDTLAVPTLIVSNQSPPIGATINLSGSGGTPPYSYFISSGDGSVNTTNNTYTAPSSVGQVTLGIKDSAGTYGYLPINIVASSTGSGVLAISPLNPQIAPGGTINYTVSGGTPPYSYSVNGTTGGNSTFGTVSNTLYTSNPSQGTAVFTAAASQGQVQMTIADTAGNSQIVQISVVGNFSSTPLNASFQTAVDPYLGFSFDGSTSAGTPYFGFFDEGAGLDNTSVAAGDSNCLAGGTVSSPCFVPVQLANFNPNIGAGVSYRGTISASYGATVNSISYCIPPVHRTYAFIKATQGTYIGGGITFNATGKTLFEQQSTTSVFFFMNTGSPVLANITVTGAYDGTHVDCSDYDGTQYVNVGM